MKGKQIFYWLSLLLCLAVAGCSSDGEDEVTPKDEPGEEGGGEQTGREVWSFDVKVMLDRATFKSYGSSANVVNNKLKQRFKEVRELYHGKKGITYFDADIEFVPFFDETCVYDCSSQEVLDHAVTYRGDYPYLVMFDGKVGDFSDERVHSDWTGWGIEVVCISDNNKGAPDGGATTYDILSPYKTSECLAHELGHARGVPDIYAMEVKTNPISGTLFSPVTCMMNICWGGDSWSEYAQLLINRNKNLVRGQEGFIPLEEPQYPKNLVLNITRDGQPVKYAAVNIYREEMYKNTVDVTAFMKKTLGTDGLLSLSPVTLFNGAGGGIGYGVLLIEVVDGESKTYRYIPVYEVQIAYLKGDTDQYTIEIKCD